MQQVQAAEVLREEVSASTLAGTQASLHQAVNRGLHLYWGNTYVNYRYIYSSGFKVHLARKKDTFYIQIINNANCLCCMFWWAGLSCLFIKSGWMCYVLCMPLSNFRSSTFIFWLKLDFTAQLNQTRRQRQSYLAVLMLVDSPIVRLWLTTERGNTDIRIVTQSSY